jgi:hypothetical protein
VLDVELDFKTVRERWLRAGGKDTGGIISWFEAAVERWVESEIPAQEVAELRFIGAEGGGRWANGDDVLVSRGRADRRAGRLRRWRASKMCASRSSAAIAS